MTALLDSCRDWCMGTPLGLSLLGAHWLYYAVPAWVILVARLIRRRVSRLELAAFGCFSLFVLLEAVQLAVDSTFWHHPLWGLARYFGVFAPFLWIWTAKGVSDLWSCGAGNRGLRYATRLLLVAALGWMTVCSNLIPLAATLTGGDGREAQVAAEKAAAFIRKDYAGPVRQDVRKPTMQEYFTTRRPVVFGNFAAAAWAVRGQSEGADENRVPSRCPYLPDYRFICLGRKGETDFTVDVDEDAFEFVCGFPGMETVWGLFRRKGTPHR